MTQATSTESRYKAFLRVEAIDTDGGSDEYTAALMYDEKIIHDLDGKTIVDVCDGLVKILMKEKPTRPIQVEIQGYAGRGNELFKGIVDLYNSNS